MKKIMILLLFSMAAHFTQAQVAFRYTAANPTGAISNTTSDTAYYSLTKGYKMIGIQPVVTKASGTMAGVLRFYASIDGTNYVTLSDTLALTNVTTNTALFSWAQPWRYWRIIQSGGTTVTGTLAAKLIAVE